MFSHALKLNFTPPVKVWMNPFCAVYPMVTVVIPIFNQEKIVKDVLKSIMRNLSLPYELFLIDDASEDLSNNEIRNYFEDINFAEFQNVRSVSLFKNRFSRFETWCDDFGIRKSKTDFCLEIQADMLIDDFGFDKRMLEAMIKYPELAILSGRGIEPLAPIISSFEKYMHLSDRFDRFLLINLKKLVRNLATRLFKLLHSNSLVQNIVSEQIENEFIEKSDENFLLTGQAGRLGMLIENRISEAMVQSRKIYFGETLMRGPLFLNRELYLELKGFDTKRFFLGFDDHDYCARVSEAGLRVGYTPVSFDSPLVFGSTRKNRSLKSEFLVFFNMIRIRMLMKNSSLFNIWSHQMNSTFVREIKSF